VLKTGLAFVEIVLEIAPIGLEKGVAWFAKAQRHVFNFALLVGC